MTGNPLSSAAGRIRPRDRRDRIIDTASWLFYTSGYHRVGMAELAEAVGITGGALYRHFSSKQDLLLHAITRGLVAVEQVLAPHVDGDGAPDLDVVVRQMSTVALDHRELGVLWQREARHLATADRVALGKRVSRLATQLAVAVRGHRPDLMVQDAELLAWCALSVLSSPSYHRVSLATRISEHLLYSITMQALTVTSPLRAAEDSRAARPDREIASTLKPRMSRREELLTAAVERFAARGYSAVTMADIGRAAGISSPSIYNHFSSKNQILRAALWRGHDWLQLELSRITRSSGSTDQALEGLLRSYTDFAFDQCHLVQMLITEVHHLADDQRRAVIQGQRDYIRGWVSLLCASRPELDSTMARYLVHAALTVANDFGRMGRLFAHGGLRRDVVAVGRAVVDSPLPTLTAGTGTGDRLPAEESHEVAPSGLEQ